MTTTLIIFLICTGVFTLGFYLGFELGRSVSYSEGYADALCDEQKELTNEEQFFH